MKLSNEDYEGEDAKRIDTCAEGKIFTVGAKTTGDLVSIDGELVNLKKRGLA